MMLKMENRRRYETLIAPHLPAAYNLAHWMTRNDQDAEDVTQEACLRACKFFDSFRGGDSRAWLLRIVRNTCYTWLQQNRARELTLSFQDEQFDLPCETYNPETIVLQKVGIEQIRRALEELPVEFREVMVLRELEGFSYREIAQIADVPLGTVMSRLARGRKRLQDTLQNTFPMESKSEEREARHEL